MNLKLLNSTHQESISNILKTHESKDFERFGLKMSVDQIEHALNKNMAFGIFDEEKLLAFVLGRKVDQDIFEIDMTMTDKSELKKGHMENLFKELIKRLKSDENFYKVWLEVHEENTPALSFYKKMGFDENSKRPRYYPDGKAAILMTLSL